MISNSNPLAAAGRRPLQYVCSRKRGTVLIVSMWIVLVLAGLILAFARTARVEAIEAANCLAAAQAEAVAAGALQYALANVQSAQGSPAALADLLCEQVQLGDGYFWLLQPRPIDGHTYTYGITDEASKLNLNTATLNMLSMLPDMTVELAPAIVDWRDPGSDPTPGGAEDDYYLSLPDPYHCKNAPLETVEEVLLIKGGSRDILYGYDTNRSGVLDPGETVDMTGRLDCGFSEYATVYSVEPNTSANGRPRIDINNTDTQALSTLLRNALGAARASLIMNRVRSGRPFRNVFDFRRRAGLTSQEFAAVVDRLTTDRRTSLPGLINVNTAPQEVLLCLPGLDQGDVAALLANRPVGTSAPGSVAWVADALTAEKAVAIGSYVTARSYQYCVDIVSISGNGRAFKRYRAVVDARQSPARVVYWRDLTDLGWPLPAEIPAMLRRGEQLTQADFSVGLR
jgi:type II secretory pathway component PulK